MENFIDQNRANVFAVHVSSRSDSGMTLGFLSKTFKFQ